MQTIDEVKKHCREVGEGIAAAVAAGEDLGRRFESSQMMRLLGGKAKRGNVKVVGGKLDGDDGGVVVVERGVFKSYADKIACSVFNAESSEAVRVFTDTACWR